MTLLLERRFAGRTRPRCVAAVVLLAGCGMGGGRAAANAPETAASWGAAAHMTAMAWLDHGVPTAYTRRSIHAAREGLAEQLDAVRARPSSVRNAKALIQRLESVAAAGTALDTLLEHGTDADRPAVAAVAGTLRARVDSLSPWIHTDEGFRGNSKGSSE